MKPTMSAKSVISESGWVTVRAWDNQPRRMPFDLQPVLKGELLELRPLRADHFDDLFKVATDPMIWEQHPNSDRYKRHVFRKFFDEALASGGALIALDLKDGRLSFSSRWQKAVTTTRLRSIRCCWLRARRGC